MLASPGRSSGRVLPPSLFPVVPAQRARLGLRRPGTTRLSPEAETAVHQIFEVPPAPVHLLGTDPPELAAAPYPDGDDGWGARPRSIGPLGGSANGLPGTSPAEPRGSVSSGASSEPARPAVVEPSPGAAAGARRPTARRRGWWRRP